MYNKSIFFLVMIFSITSMQAQSVENTAGGSVAGSGGSASYSAGNVFYKELYGSNGSATPGIQHPFEIIPTLGIDQQFIKLELSVYPNPFTDFLNLIIDSENKTQYSLELYDFKGTLLRSESMRSKTTQISMVNYPSAIYLLSVKQDNKLIKTFKIIKK